MTVQERILSIETEGSKYRILSQHVMFRVLCYSISWAWSVIRCRLGLQLLFERVLLYDAGAISCVAGTLWAANKQVLNGEQRQNLREMTLALKIVFCWFGSHFVRYLWNREMLHMRYVRRMVIAEKSALYLRYVRPSVRPLDGLPWNGADGYFFENMLRKSKFVYCRATASDTWRKVLSTFIVAGDIKPP